MSSSSTSAVRSIPPGAGDRADPPGTGDSSGPGVPGRLPRGPLRVVLAANPISGRGIGLAVADETAETLAAAGHAVRVVPTQLAPPREWLDPTLEDADVLVVVGGDGAMRMAADAAIRQRVPVHHLPLGTENLFAREFDARRDADQLAARLAAGRVGWFDAAEAEDQTFLLMASIGFDADVVHDLAAHREGAIRHLSYIRPIVRRTLRWRAPRLTVEVDGTTIAADLRGTVIVVNCRQYGGRLDPVPGACMDDGRLDVIVLPARGGLGALRTAAACRLRRARRLRGVVVGRGERISVRCDPPSLLQLDGDPAGGLHRPVPGIDVQVRPAVLPVLIPAPSAVR